MDYVFYYYYAYQQSCHQIKSVFFIFYLSCILQYFYDHHPYHSSISIKAWQSLQHFMLAPSRLLISNWYFSSYGYSSYSSISGSLLNLFFLSIRVFFHRHWRFTGQSRKGGDHLLFHYTTSTCSRTLRHLFAALQVRRLSRIFNSNSCVYLTATQWDLPPYRITIWVIDWWCNVCLFTWWIDSKFLLQRFNMGNRWIWTRIKLLPSHYKLID